MIKFKDQLVYLIIAVFMFAGLAWAEKPHGVSHTGSLWVGDRDGTATITPGNDDLVVIGSFEAQGGTVAASNNAGANATVTLTAADSGETFINNTQATEYDLPADPTGLTFTFIVGSTTQLNVDPNGSDQIINKTADTGYYYWADALGETLVLKGISTSQWAVVSEIGTWTDGGTN